MSKLDKQSIFEAWLGQNMSPEQQQQFETLCIEDKEFAARVESLNIAAAIGDQQQQLTPPAWDKESFFEPAQKQSWWQWQGLPATSMVFSVVAMLMVVSGFNIEYSQDRISFGFGNSVSNSDVDLIVQQRITEFQTANMEANNQYLQALRDQQLAVNSQLTEYVLTSNRQERREDFAELFKLINQQRYDDQVFFARQLNDLQDEISLQTGVPINTVNPISDISLDE